MLQPHVQAFTQERMFSKCSPLGELHPADPLPRCFAAHPDAGAVWGLSAHGGGGTEQHPGEGGYAGGAGGVCFGNEGACSIPALTAQQSLDFISA